MADKKVSEWGFRMDPVDPTQEDFFGDEVPIRFHSDEMLGMQQRRQQGKPHKEIEEFACFLSKEPSTLWKFYLDLVRNQAEMYKGLRDAIRLEAARDSE